jgi:hypothetical protein
VWGRWRRAIHESAGKVVTPDGYASAVPIVFVEGGAPAADEITERSDAVRTEGPGSDARATPERMILRRLEQTPAASVPELADALELSASTVLRALRNLVHQDRVARTGAARATRYRARG